MINELLKFLTLKKEKGKCGFCKKLIILKRYKQKIKNLAIINVVEGGYCSRKCKKAFNKALKKAFKHKKLTKQEKEAIKNVHYVDIKIPPNR